MTALNELIFNFWSWWYVEQFWELLQKEYTWLSLVVRFSQLDVAVRFFFVPIYKNYSLTGRLFSLTFRSMQVFLGLIILTLAFIGLVMLLVVYVLFPLSPVVSLWQMLL